MGAKDHPARPEQTRHGFEKGQETTADSPDIRREGGFEEGQETTGDSPDKGREGGFSEGQETI